MSEHSYKQYDADLEAIRSRVMEMGGLVEEQIHLAIETLKTGSEELADRVISNDMRVNALEVNIDELCTMLIAKRQPAAGDLRMIMTVVKTITDLERIGDKAEKIARLTKQINQQGMISRLRTSEIERMSQIVVEMLREALDSFARMDATKAAEIARRDKEVDDVCDGVLRQLITYMMEDPRNITAFLDVMFVTKAIERIGDHATNISEYVVYMVKGKDVRHTSVEDLERQARGE